MKACRPSHAAVCLGFMLTCSLLLTGCWDIKDPQDVHYVTAVAFDYEDEQYVVYAQMIDFSSVTSPESDKPTNKLPVYVGKGTGDTVASAYNDLYNASQLRTFHGHVGAIVFGEKLLKRGIGNILDLLTRYHEFRYTAWVFGSRESLEEVLSASPFFNLSPIASLLHQPQELYKQKSIVAPKMLRELVTDIREPGRTAHLPSLGLDQSIWKESMKPTDLLVYNGIFTLHSYECNGFFPVDDLRGLRWLTPSTQRSPLTLRDGNNVYSDLSLRHPKVKIRAEIQDNKITYRLQTKLKANVIEVIQPIDEREMEELAAEQVTQEILATYQKAYEQGVDLFQLEHALYVQHNRWWQEHIKGRKLVLPAPEELNIEVDVNVSTSGKLKLQTK